MWGGVYPLSIAGAMGGVGEGLRYRFAVLGSDRLAASSFLSDRNDIKFLMRVILDI